MITIHMILKYLITIIFLLGLAIVAPQANAAGSCQKIYNGGTVCSQSNGTLTIDKFLQNPRTNSYTNNLRQDQYVFSAGENVNFRLQVTNTSDNPISNITIVDTLPSNLDFGNGDGTFDTKKHTVTIKLNSLASKATQTYNYQAVVNTKALPGNQPTACVLNQVIVQTTSFFFFTSTQGQNNATVCLGTKPTGMPTIVTPTTVNPTTSVPVTEITPKVIVYLTPTPTILPQIHKTKGGQTVYTAPNTSQTPPTGPNPLSLLFLLPLFFVGKYIRRIV